MRQAWKPLLAGLTAFAAARLTGAPDLAQAVVAAVVYAGVALATRAIPSEVFDAMRRRSF